MLFPESNAVTVKLIAVPAVALPGAETTKWVVTASTSIAPLVPVNAVDVSVAVIDWLPGVLRVALNVPWPFVNVASAGSDAAPSLLVKWIVPA